jgi:hypothetical protein
MARTARELETQVTLGLGAPARAPSLLERLLIGPGSAVLCLGSPEVRALEALSERVGPSGVVTVVETDVSVTAAARLQVYDVALPNVEILWRSRWAGGIGSSSFDVVQVREPLGAMPQLRRRRLVRRALAMVKPGGWIVSTERRSLLDPSPWRSIRLYQRYGLVAVSTEPIEADLGPGTDGPAADYLVWGRKTDGDR